MHLTRIDSTDDPRIAEYREIPDAELVRARGLFVAEGRRVVGRVLQDRRFRVHSILVNDAARTQLEAALNTLDADVPVYLCEADDFLAITGYNIHRGCLALVERLPATPIDALVENATTIVVLEGVTNADNVGGVFRNAAAFGPGGVVGVLLSPTCCDPFYRKAIRTSMGAVLRVPFARAERWPAAIDEVRAAGFTIVALTPREPSQTLAAFQSRPRPERVALIVGTEGAGLTPEVEAAADYRVRIPTSGEVDSLNLAVAAGIALYELTSSRGHGAAPVRS
jgi:tRNA G18 (ribose-2'-O)-methylase SpoU